MLVKFHSLLHIYIQLHAREMSNKCVLKLSLVTRYTPLITKGYITRRIAIEYAVPLVTDIKCAKLLVKSLAFLNCQAPPLKTFTDCISSHRTLRLPGLIDTHVHVREPGGWSLFSHFKPSFSPYNVSLFLQIRSDSQGRLCVLYGGGSGRWSHHHRSHAQHTPSCGRQGLSHSRSEGEGGREGLVLYCVHIDFSGNWKQNPSCVCVGRECSTLLHIHTYFPFCLLQYQSKGLFLHYISEFTKRRSRKDRRCYCHTCLSVLRYFHSCIDAHIEWDTNPVSPLLFFSLLSPCSVLGQGRGVTMGSTWGPRRPTPPPSLSSLPSHWLSRCTSTQPSPLYSCPPWRRG